MEKNRSYYYGKISTLLLEYRSMLYRDTPITIKIPALKQYEKRIQSLLDEAYPHYSQKEAEILLHEIAEDINIMNRRT